MASNLYGTIELLTPMPKKFNPFLIGNLDFYQNLTLGSTTISGATAGPVFFGGTGGTLQQDTTFVYDDTNNRLGIGTASPTAALDIRAVPASGVPVLAARSTADTTQATVEFYSHTGNAIFTLKQHPSTSASGIITNVTQINGLDSIGLSSSSGVGSSSAISINSGNFVVGYNSASTYGYLATRLAAGLSFQVNSIERLAISTAGNVLVNGFTSSTVGLIVKGAAAQTANLTEWQNSSGTVLSSINSAGRLAVLGSLNGNYAITCNGRILQNNEASTSYSYIGDDGLWEGTAGTDVAYASYRPKFKFYTNSSQVESFHLASTGVVFNETGADRDFRIEGDTDANLFFVDASTDRIGIGTSAPAAPLDVYKATSAISQIFYRASIGANPLLTLGEDSIGTNYGGSLVLHDGTGGGGNIKLIWSQGYPKLQTTATSFTFLGSGFQQRFSNSYTDIAVSGVTGFYLDSGSMGVFESVPGARLHVTIGSASAKGLIVKAAASQTANLQEWQNSSGTVLASISAAGVITTGSAQLGSGSLSVTNAFHTILWNAAIFGWSASSGVGPTTTNFDIAMYRNAAGILEINNGTPGTFADLKLRKMTASGVVNMAAYTVATLPAGVNNDRAFVTDALAPAFGAAVVGGGAVRIPVYYDGAWKVG